MRIPGWGWRRPGSGQETDAGKDGGGRGGGREAKVRRRARQGQVGVATRGQATRQSASDRERKGLGSEGVVWGDRAPIPAQKQGRAGQGVESEPIKVRVGQGYGGADKAREQSKTGERTGSGPRLQVRPRMRSWLGWGKSSTGSEGKARGGASNQDGEHSGSGICVIRASVRMGGRGRTKEGAGQRAGSSSQEAVKGRAQAPRKSGVNHNREGGGRE